MDRPTPVGQRGEVVGMHKCGKSSTEIAKELNMSERTVRNIIQQYEERGTLEPQHSPGRPSKLDERYIRHVVNIYRKDRSAPLKDVVDQLHIRVSTRTLRKALQKNGIFARVAVTKPFLTSQQKRARLAFAKEHKGWTVDDWKRVIWTDESTFEIGRNFRRIYVRRTKDEKYDEGCIVPSFKSGRSSGMVWGAFPGSQKSDIVHIPPDQRTAVDFVDLVYNGALLGFLGEISGGILMEDGAPVHRSNVSKYWRNSRMVETIKWPANSPDLNPMEQIWYTLKDAVQHKRVRPSSIHAMVEIVKEEWANVGEDFLNKLCSSMPKRIQAVIDANGGHTRY